MASFQEDAGAYCFLDIDINDSLTKRSLAAAFVHGTSTRYSLSSQNLLHLGGSELTRLPDFFAVDHEWSGRGDADFTPVSKSCRIVVKLDTDVPLTTENFRFLCHNEKHVGECGKVINYDGCTVHRVVPGFVMQGGDMVFGNGSGGESMYGKKFKDERSGLGKKHDRRGILSMGNGGKNSNTSQFFLTLAATPACDGKHVVFGEVLSGFDVLDDVEALGSKDGTPICPITITKAGLWSRGMPSKGYWLMIPDDSFSGSTAVFIAWPRIKIVAPNEQAVAKFKAACLSVCYCIFVGDALSADLTLLAPAVSDYNDVGGFGLTKKVKPIDVPELLLDVFKSWSLDRQRKGVEA